MHRLLTATFGFAPFGVLTTLSNRALLTMSGVAASAARNACAHRATGEAPMCTLTMGGDRSLVLGGTSKLQTAMRSEVKPCREVQFENLKPPAQDFPLKLLASYDAHRVRDYANLYALLGRLGAVPLHFSLWIVEGAFSAAQLRDAMMAAMDNDDSIAVIEFPPGAQWATYNVSQEAVSALGGSLAA